MATASNMFQTSQLKQKIETVTKIVNNIIVRYNINENKYLNKELYELLRYFDNFSSIESKSLREMIIKMAIASEACLAGAITADQFATYMVKNGVISSLINTVDYIF